MPPDEFGLIAKYFAPLAAGFPGALGLTDDAAFLPADAAHETVVTVDAIVAGVHFLPDDPAGLVARKLVRVNLSDLAAKGAVPFAVMLSAAFPHGTGDDWLQAFADGLAEDLKAYGTALIGGDTVSTPGPLTLSLTALGRVEAGRGIKRSGASVGDAIWVSGTIGDGALGLLVATGKLASNAELLDRYRLPQPRVDLGPRLVGLATAAMDVSDGLVQDLGHLMTASGVGGVVEAAAVPLSAAAAAALALDHSLLAMVLTGGDDYELLFTAPLAVGGALSALAADIGVALTPIGRVVAGQGVTVRGPDGRSLALEHGGWRHFRGEAG
ncbi:MAG: thiamine-phosphate kinase [Magnetospirillum sp.]|nr:thiamine-phosphate kinase [Magnetospirillum sp.]